MYAHLCAQTAQRMWCSIMPRVLRTRILSSRCMKLEAHVSSSSSKVVAPISSASCRPQPLSHPRFCMSFFDPFSKSSFVRTNHILTRHTLLTAHHGVT